MAALLSGKLEDELIACEGNEELWKIYLDRVLSMLRIENTQEFGLWYSLVGSFSAPVYTSQPWPEDAIDYSAIADE